MSSVGGVVGAWTYPRIVRQILTSRSTPQPAIMKTPRGGTERLLALYRVPRSESNLVGEALTEDGDDDEEDGGDGVCSRHCCWYEVGLWFGLSGIWNWNRIRCMVC
jgi:hypothetical protein